MPTNVPILLVEDDLVDVKAIKRAFQQHKLTNPLYVCSNGAQALTYLRHEPPYTDPASAPPPGIILLDINMPVMNGIEFLREMKADPAIKQTPVIVLTTSKEDSDRIQGYELGIAGYIVKPTGFPKFFEAIKVIDLYWSLCELPS
ncbi:MAG: CheY-like chemotaxis protein [Hyphomicrobiaceae bacterium]|jgi:CheY-like chemotaxis protein